jgi:hypothetical protein
VKIELVRMEARPTVLPHDVRGAVALAAAPAALGPDRAWCLETVVPTVCRPAAPDGTHHGGQALLRDPAIKQPEERTALAPLGNVLLRVPAVAVVALLALEYRCWLLADSAIVRPTGQFATRHAAYYRSTWPSRKRDASLSHPRLPHLVRRLIDSDQ